MDNLIDKNNNIIIWQKWMDPFGEDDIIDLFDDSDNMKQEFDNFEVEDEENEEDQSNLKQIFKNHNLITNRKNIKVMATPMGIIPFTENTASSKIFNFWIGHTNFNITKNIALLIESIAGVESLDIFTRYRFRIAIGKAFKDSDVMQDINQSVYEYIT